MGTKRRSYESGHTPRCLLIVDETAECDRAVYYAGRWAARTGGQLVMLRVIEIEDRKQQWLGVADVMRAEAQDEANDAFDRAAARIKALAGTPERIIREGIPSEQILDVIENDADIAMLILASATGPEGPGPIVTATAKMAGTFPIPIVVVPGGLSDDEIDAMS
jgi:nucleotide-binding universal stress UspA family protein